MDRQHRADSTRARRDADRTRVELLDAAQRVFAERGFEATSLRDITDRTGVAHGMIRHHFRTKDGLWQAVVDRAVDRYRAALAPYASQSAEDPADVLAASRAAVRSFMEVNSRHPEVVRLALHESVRGGHRLDYLLDRLAPIADLMAPRFRRVQSAGYLRQFDQPAFLLFLLTAGTVPFVLPALTAGLLGAPLRPGTGPARRHIERILDTIYCTSPSD
jgi:AcrR family transcriptional regulator